MRELSYGVDGKAANLRTFAVDGPGHGGACHEYMVRTDDADELMLLVSFQDGPIGNNQEGVNGVQNEDLIAIVIDRLEGFQSGKFACTENADALMYLRDALQALQDRTRARITRGVEGTHQV